MAEDRDVTQDLDLGEKTYSVAVTPFTEEGYANVYGRDITERKRAEQALRKAKDELEERVKERTYELYAESLYARSLIEASLDPLVTISVDGKIMDVNHASEEVTGVSRAQLIGSD
jgi:PAS domain-containing protein